MLVFMSNESFLFKIVLLGEGAVGKTSLRKRFMGEGFEESVVPKLIGQNFNYMTRQMDWMLIGYRRNVDHEMKEVLKNLSLQDIEAIADYLSRAIEQEQ